MTVVAIDGPAGAGKSTIAAALAARLGVAHVDTGAVYRAATLVVLRAGIDVSDGPACARVIEGADISRADHRTILDGEDVTTDIRDAAVTAAVSAVSAHPEVRRALLDLQRAQVAPEGAVVEGRDVGTVVVPDADLKVWLTAALHERAARRAAQLGGTDRESIGAYESDLQRRDVHDSGQMTPAPDAVVVDTTGRSVDDLVGELAARALEAEAAR